jgi:hypothetical protein
MARGKLRIYLGAAPGVGKTYAMFSEAHRRVERGTDCVVAFVEHHHRPRTEVMLHGLEEIPRKELEYRGTVFTEMDVDAVLARRPEAALVDELPHTNIPGSRNAKRWQDVEEARDGARRHVEQLAQFVGVGGQGEGGLHPAPPSRVLSDAVGVEGRFVEPAAYQVAGVAETVRAGVRGYRRAGVAHGLRRPERQVGAVDPSCGGAQGGVLRDGSHGHRRQGRLVDLVEPLLQTVECDLRTLPK